MHMNMMNSTSTGTMYHMATSCMCMGNGEKELMEWGDLGRSLEEGKGRGRGEGSGLATKGDKHAPTL